MCDIRVLLLLQIYMVLGPKRSMETYIISSKSYVTPRKMLQKHQGCGKPDIQCMCESSTASLRQWVN